jgi:phage gp45-like
MHRATPLDTSFRSYVAGGARSVIDQADDSKLMQEMGGNFMKGETRSAVESPQNYGFTSVVHDSDKDGDGNITGGAEGFVSFMGGNRSFPVCGVMDDRRHRLKKLDKGDVAMFRGKDDQQQFHLTGDGGFWSAADDKTVRMQLVPKKQQQQQGQGQGGGASRAADGASGGGGNGQGGQGQQATGQESVYKDGKDGTQYVDVTGDATRCSGKNVKHYLDDKECYYHASGADKMVYHGGEKDKHTFAKIMTESGPSSNCLARVDALAADEDPVVFDARGQPVRRRPYLAAAAVALIAFLLGATYQTVRLNAQEPAHVLAAFEE